MIKVDNVSMRFMITHDRVQSLKEYITKIKMKQKVR